MRIAETILLMSALIIALGVIFAALRKARMFFRKIDRLGSLLEDMTEHFGNAPDAFKILQDIIAQFRTNSGSSLKDQMDALTGSIASLTDVARSNKVASIVLENQIDAIKEIAKMDRDQATAERAHIMRLLQQVEGQVAMTKSTADDLKEELKKPDVDQR